MGSLLDNGAGTSSNTGSVEGGDGKDTQGADSLASPSAVRPPPSAARCIMCNAPLALAEGTPKLMECLHSICEPCLKAKIEEKQASSRDFLGLLIYLVFFIFYWLSDSQVEGAKGIE